jgi:DNA-binding response OmpR family regulator
MRVLLVEDESKVARFIARGLTEERYAVDTAADGTSGVELATTYHYDVVILDLMLPGLNGTEVLRQIRRKVTSVPVLVWRGRRTNQYGGFRRACSRSPVPRHRQPR